MGTVAMTFFGTEQLAAGTTKAVQTSSMSRRGPASLERQPHRPEEKAGQCADYSCYVNSGKLMSQSGVTLPTQTPLPTQALSEIQTFGLAIDQPD